MKGVDQSLDFRFLGKHGILGYSSQCSRCYDGPSTSHKNYTGSKTKSDKKFA